LLKPSVFGFLLSDVFSDHFLAPTYGRDVVASGPEVLPNEIRGATAKGSRDVDSTLSLDEPNHLRHRALRRDGDVDVDVVRT